MPIRKDAQSNCVQPCLEPDWGHRTDHLGVVVARIQDRISRKERALYTRRQSQAKLRCTSFVLVLCSTSGKREANPFGRTNFK